MVSLDQHRTHLLWDLSGNRLEGIREKLISKFFCAEGKGQSLYGSKHSRCWKLLLQLYGAFVQYSDTPALIWTIYLEPLLTQFVTCSFKSKLTPQTLIKGKSKTIYQVSCDILVCQSNLFLMGLAPASPLHPPLWMLSRHFPCPNVTPKKPCSRQKKIILAFRRKAWDTDKPGDVSAVNNHCRSVFVSSWLSVIY